VVDQLKNIECCPDAHDQLPVPNGIRDRLWLLFEYPESSPAAFVIGIASVVTTLVSIVLFCVETLPVFALTHCVQDEAPNFADPFFVIETTCTAWFTIEILVRFVGCPSKLDFCKDVKNLVDVGAVLPYYITLVNVLLTMSCEGAKSSASLAFLRVTRLRRSGSPRSLVKVLPPCKTFGSFSLRIRHLASCRCCRRRTDLVEVGTVQFIRVTRLSDLLD